MPGYTSDLYNYIVGIDPTFKNDISFDQFKSKMSDVGYSKNMYDWIGQNDNTFHSDVSFDAFREKLGYKKKETTVLPSEQKPKPISSGTQSKANQKPSGTSVSVKPEGLYSAPGNALAVFKKTADGWYVDNNRSGNFIKIQKGDVEKRVAALESTAKKFYDPTYEQKTSWQATPSKQEVKPVSKESQITERQFEEPIGKELAQKAFEEEFFIAPKKGMSSVEQVNFVAREKAKKELGEGASEQDLLNAEQKYKESGTLKMLQRKGYDVDVNGSINDPKSQKALAEFNANEDLRLKAEAKQDKLSNSIDNIVNSKLMGLTEEQAVPQLNKQFGKYGFVFDQAGIGDAMTVRYSADGITYTEPVDIDLQSGDPVEQMNLLKSFMKSKYLNDSEVAALNNEKLDAKKLVKITLSDPQKYAEYGLSEGQFENYITSEYRNANALKTQIDNKLSQFKNLTIAYQTSGDERILGQLRDMESSIKNDQEKLTYAVADIEQTERKYKESVGSYILQKEKQGNFIGGLFASAAKGVASAPKMVMNIGMDILPEFLPNAGLNPLEYQKMKDEGFSDAQIENKVSSQLKRTIGKDINQGIANIGSLGTVQNEYFSSVDRNILEQAVFGLTESVGAAVSGGGNAVAQGLAFFGMSYNAMQDELSSKEFDELDKWEKQAISGVYGLVIGQLEKIGFNMSAGQMKNPLLKKFTATVVKNALKDMPENATIETIDQLIGTSLKNTMRSTGAKVVNGALSEGATEGIQSLSETGMKNIVNEIHDKKVFEYVPDLTTKKGIADALGSALYEAAAGAIGGAIMGSFDTYRQSRVNEQSDEKFENMYQSLMDDNTLRAVKLNEVEKYKNGDISKDQMQSNIREINTTVSTLNKIPTELDTRGKRVAFELLSERDGLQSKIQGKDPNLVTVEINRINEIDNQLKTIGENAVKESTKPVEEGPAEGGGVQYQGTQEGQPEVREGERPVGETAQPEADLGDRAVEGRGAEEALKDVESTAKYLELENKTDDELQNAFDVLSKSKDRDVIILSTMIENIQEKRERFSVLNSNLENISDIIDQIFKKEEYFLEKREGRETKDVAKKYIGEVSKNEAKKDFKDSFFGNPNTWLADALKMKESVRVYMENGGTFKELLSSVQKEFEGDGFTEQDAANVIKNKLESLTKKDFRQQQISEAYHEAKQYGSNPELVKAVEGLFGKPTEVKEVAVSEQQQKAEETKTIDKAINYLEDLEKKLTDFGKGTLGINIPVAILKPAVSVAKKSLQAGKQISEAIADAVDYIKSTDFYKSLSDTDKKQAESNVNDLFTGKKTFEDITEVKKENIDKLSKLITEDVKDINKIISIAKENNFSDNITREYLKQKNGLSDKEATDAINKYNIKEEDIWVPSEGKLSERIKTSLQSFRKRFFSARSFLPKSVFAYKEEKEASVASHLNIVDQNVTDFNRLYNSYKGDKDQLRKDFDSYIRGNKEIELPEEFRIVANSMRNQIDGLSQQLIDNGLVDADMAQTIKDNLGQYLTRSYRVYDRENWKNEVQEEVKQQALNFLRAQYRPMAEEMAAIENMPVEEALDNLVNNKLNEMLDKAGATNFIKGSRLGSKDLSVLKERQDIPFEIRALMGEYADPALNYARTILKMSSLAANHNFLTQVKEAGMGKYFFEKNDPRRGKEFNTQIATEGSEAMNPLNGLYTTKEIAEAFQAQPNELGKLMQMFMKLQSGVRWAKTIGSIGTHFKNVIGNLGFVWINAHWKYMDKAYIAVKNDLLKSNNQQKRDIMNNYIKLGIVKQSAGLGEIMDMFKDANFDVAMASRLSNEKLGLLGKAKRFLFFKPKKFLEDMYQAEDDFFKIVAYENELQRYSNALFDKSKNDLTEQELKEVNKVVTEIVKNTYPTYDRIPNAVKLIRRFPFVGNFISFQAEAYRTAFNTIALAKDELTSENKKIKQIGAVRLAGATTYLSAKTAILQQVGMAAGTGLTGVIGYLFDDDDEEQKDKDIREFVAPWSKESDLIVLQAGNGKLQYIDFSATDPHGAMKKAINAFLLGESTTDSFIDGVIGVISPFVGEEMTTEAILALKNNRDKYGKEIWNPEDSEGEKTKAILVEVYKLIEPGTISSIRRGVASEDKGRELVANLTGFRTYDVDLNKQFGFKTRDYSERIKNAKRIYNSAFYNEKATDKEKKDAYNKANDALKLIYGELINVYNSAERLGVKPEDLENSMKEFGNMSKADILKIKAGETPELKSKEEEEVVQKEIKM